MVPRPRRPSWEDGGPLPIWVARLTDRSFKAKGLSGPVCDVKQKVAMGQIIKFTSNPGLLDLFGVYFEGCYFFLLSLENIFLDRKKW